MFKAHSSEQIYAHVPQFQMLSILQIIDFKDIYILHVHWGTQEVKWIQFAGTIIQVRVWCQFSFENIQDSNYKYYQFGLSFLQR